MSEPQPCAATPCPALALPGAELCAVHASYTRRADDDTPIHCYACGKLIRQQRRWVVRAEGAFHARPSCLMAAPSTYVIAAASVAAAPELVTP